MRRCPHRAGVVGVCRPEVAGRPAGEGLGVTYLNVALIVVALYAVNIWLRFSDPASLAVGIALSAIGLGALSASTWLGDKRSRVYKE